jgi:hypothetical protein
MLLARKCPLDRTTVMSFMVLRMPQTMNKAMRPITTITSAIAVFMQ